MSQDDIERWKPVKDWEDTYSVSCRGRVRLEVDLRRKKAGDMVPQFISVYGYPIVHFRVNKVARMRFVHRLVAFAFLGDPPPGKPEVNHINAIKSDPRLENLEWVSRKENMIHAMAMGLIHAKGAPGERNASAKLKPGQVIEIRRLKGVMYQKDIATMFGVSQQLVSAIQTNVAWSHLEDSGQ